MSTTPCPVGNPAAPLAPKLRAALDHLAIRRDAFIRDLSGLCGTAGVSSVRPSTEDMRLSAALVAAVADQAGLEHVSVHEFQEAHPYVTADWLHAPGAPTILFYSHHDVQPFGNEAAWNTPPTHPDIREGRLYARGAVDDKGGIVQLSAIACCLRGARALPCNVRVLVDGEEEVGSPHLDRFLAARPELVAADVVVVVDTPNAATGQPAITSSLRGNVTVDVEVLCLEAPIHSGRGAGLVPDPIQVLCTILHRLTGESGELLPTGCGAVSGDENPSGRDAGWRAGAPSIGGIAPSFDEATYRREVGLRPGVRLCGNPCVAPLDRVWRRLALTVIAFEAPHIEGSSNQIAASARARLSLRTGPGMDPIDAGGSLVRALVSDPPFNAEVQASVVRCVRGWCGDSSGAAYAAARTALEKGYGRPAMEIGAGGSIGFMGAITRTLPGAPCLLLGLEDPGCNAHAPNESIDLGDWESATRSLIHLMHDLASG